MKDFFKVFLQKCTLKREIGKLDESILQVLSNSLWVRVPVQAKLFGSSLDPNNLWPPKNNGVLYVPL